MAELLQARWLCHCAGSERTRRCIGQQWRRMNYLFASLNGECFAARTESLSVVGSKGSCLNAQLRKQVYIAELGATAPTPSNVRSLAGAGRPPRPPACDPLRGARRSVPGADIHARGL